MLGIAIIALLVVFTIASVLAGRHIHDLKTFVSRTTPFFPLLCSIIASFVGSVFILWHVNEGFSHGITPFLAFLGFPLQLILIGCFIAPRRIDVLTMGDLFEASYGRSFKMIVGLIVVIFNLDVIRMCLYSLSFLLGQNYELHIYSSLFLLVFILGCSFGGIISVIWMSLLQCLLMVIAPVLCVFLIFYHYGNFSAFIAHIPSAHFEFPKYYSYGQIFSLFIAAFLGNALMAPIPQTMGMAKSKEHAKVGYIMAAIFIAIFAMFLNLCGMNIAMFIVIGNNLEHAFLLIPLWLNIFIGVGLCIATLSTINTFLNIAAVAFVHDVLKPLRIHYDDLRLVRICTFLFGVFCISLSFFKSSSLIDMLFFIYTFWGPLLLAPLLGIYFNKTISKKAFFIISCLTLLAMGLWHISGLEKATEIRDLVIGLAVNFVLYGVMRGGDDKRQIIRFL